MLDNIFTIITTVISSGTLLTLLFYRPRVRVEAAKATGAELDNKIKHTDWLEARLRERDEKVDAQYKEFRAEQNAHLETIRELHAAELTIKDLEYDKCKRDMCPLRLPPRKDEEGLFPAGGSFPKNPNETEKENEPRT